MSKNPNVFGKCRIDLSQEIDPAIISKYDPNEITVYTDGAVSGNGTSVSYGGYGALILHSGSVREMISEPEWVETTNQRTELLGVIAGLTALVGYNLPTEESIVAFKKTTLIQTPVKVYTDSAYICDCIKNKWYVNWERNNRWINSTNKPVENKDLWVALLSLYRQFKSLEFVKVKGDGSDYLNAVADALAGKGKEQVRAHKMWEDHDRQ